MNRKNSDTFDDDGINIISLLSDLWNNKILIIKFFLIFSIFGVLYSLSIKNTYKSSSTFYPHYENISEATSTLKGLVGLGGINLKSETPNSVPASLYPEIVKSNSFKNEILNTKIFFEKNNISYKEYLNSKSNKKKILSYFNEIFKSKKNSNIKKYDSLNYISIIDNNLNKILDQNISISINEDEGLIKLSVIDENPEISAFIASKANKLLQKKIIDFKLKNINDLYQFTENQLEIAKFNLFKIQDSLANFKDSNMTIKSDVFKNKLSRLETEFNISKNIYNELAVSKEKTAIDVRKKTPIFTIINPVYVPIERHQPKRTILVLFFGILGVSLSSIWIISKKKIFSIIQEIKKN
tara:strand:- start:16479 stop:17540 length:1062 start_codon:yes stop_codon:yes gene_type:complete